MASEEYGYIFGGLTDEVLSTFMENNFLGGKNMWVSIGLINDRLINLYYPFNKALTNN